jgi:hypothetical protein
MIEAFGTRLRDQVDLDTLTGEVLAVVDQTIQPTQASLWLRPHPSPRPPQWGWQASNLRPSDYESVPSRPPDIA